MNIVVFGLTITSSWGNGHATLWRGLCRALGAAGHEVTFFERDLPYYAQHRDPFHAPGFQLLIYPEWAAVAPVVRRVLARADAAIVTSYCPDASPASDEVLRFCRGVRAFYDLDTPVTLERISVGDPPAYLPRCGLGAFDIVLSFGGGPALDALGARLGAKAVAPLYGSVDPRVHHPAPPQARYRSALTHLGTYSPDRRDKLEELFVRVARHRPDLPFIACGPLYPDDFPSVPNVWRLSHAAPDEHAALFSSAALSLNLTRRSMVQWGWCPSGRLFEAAACGTPQVSDAWEGLQAFFEPGEEIFVARSAADVLETLSLPRGERERVARRARERVLDEHTSERRAQELVASLEGIDGGRTYRPARVGAGPSEA